MEHYLNAIEKYAEFKGRASRAQYWYFVLFNLLISFSINFLNGLIFNGENSILSGIYALYGLAVFIPGLAVAVRRLHDTNRSGWWLLISFVPIIGAIVLLVFMVQKGTEGKNQYDTSSKTVK